MIQLDLDWSAPRFDPGAFNTEERARGLRRAKALGPGWNEIGPDGRAIWCAKTQAEVDAWRTELTNGTRQR